MITFVFKTSKDEINEGQRIVNLSKTDQSIQMQENETSS